MDTTYVDVLVIGAGISGIGAAYHLQVESPDRTYLILEGRADIGGTWDLFRYPGVRSDSDMHTLGYEFKPWNSEKSIADGPSIMAYLRETVAEYGIDRHIRFGHLVRHAEWSSETATWTVDVEIAATRRTPDVHVQLPVDVFRVLLVPPRLHTRLRRPRPLPGPHRPSAAVAGGSRRCGQTSGRHRFGRDGDDARAGDGAPRRLT